MKKIAIVCCALMLTLSLLPVRAETQRQSILQIREENQTEWRETYITDRGDTVEIDTPVTVPQVDMLPVVSVVRHRQLSDEFYETYRGDRYYVIPKERNTSHLFVLRDDYDFHIPDGFNPPDTDFKRTYFYPDSLHVYGGQPIDWNAYAEGNEYTAGEAYAYLMEKYQSFLNTYGIKDEDYEFKPNCMITLTLYYKNRKIADHYGYEFEGRQVHRGIPIAGNIGRTFVNYLNRTYWNWEGIYENWVTMGFSRPDSFSFSACLWEETGVVKEDIAVLPFEAIRPQLETLIEEDKIKEIYGVELAYLAYFTPARDAKQGMVLVPTWVVHCDYRFKPGDQPRGDEDVFHNSTYQMLAFNAQTGAFYDPLDTSRGRSDCPEIQD